ncbi:MAG: hypothetical protein LBP53_05785 [Candidatus Peribacteria bacterium]|nr:hypothetical protein [Candidatus Peribacteria bacterium]
MFINGKNQTYFSFGTLDIEHISIGGSIECIGRSIKKEERFSASNGGFDEKFPLIKRKGAFFVFKGSDIAVVDGVKV